MINRPMDQLLEVGPIGPNLIYMLENSPMFIRLVVTKFLKNLPFTIFGS